MQRTREAAERAKLSHAARRKPLNETKNMITETPIPNGKEQAELCSSALLGEKLLHILAPLSAEERAHAYVQGNTWHWPDVLAAHKPEKWDEWTDKQKYESREGQTMWRTMEIVTSEFERSRQWWREQLKRTDEAHLEWWNRQHSPNEKAHPTAAKASVDGTENL